MGCIYFETLLHDFVSKYVVAQNIFPFLNKALISEINGCYRMLFSNLRLKRTQHYD